MLLDVRNVSLPRSCPVSSFDGTVLLNSRDQPWPSHGGFFEDWRSSAASLPNIRYSNSDMCLLMNNRGVFRTAECFDPVTGAYTRSPTSHVIERYYVVDQMPYVRTGRLIKVRTRSVAGVQVLANSHGISLTRTQDNFEELVNPLVSTLFAFIATRMNALLVDDLLMHAYGPACMIPARYTTMPAMFDLKTLMTDLYALNANPLAKDEDYLYTASSTLFDRLPTVQATRSTDPKTTSHCAMVEVPFDGVDFLLNHDLVDQSTCTSLVLDRACQYMFYNKPLFATAVEVIEHLPLTDFKVSGIIRAGQIMVTDPLRVEYMCNRYSLFDNTSSHVCEFPKMVFDNVAASFCAARKAVFFGQDTLIQITRNHNDEVIITISPPKGGVGESVGFYYNLTSMTLLSPDLCDANEMHLRDVSKWGEQYEIL